MTLDPSHVALAGLLAVIAAGGWAYAILTRSRARTDREVADATRGFHLLVERSADPIIIIDRVGTITYVNPAALQVFGYSDDRIGTSALDILHPDEVDAAVARIAAANAGDSVSGVTLRRIKAADGRWVRCESLSTNLLAEVGVHGIVVVLRDVTRKLAAEAQAEEAAVLTRTILDTTTALVVTLTLGGHILSMNRAAEELTGYRSNEVVGSHFGRFVPADELATAPYEPGRAAPAHENHWTSRTGERHLIAWTSSLIEDPDGTPRSIVATGIDVTEARRAERDARNADQREHDRLAWEATHDALTQVFNRAGLLDRLDRLLAAPEAQPVSVLFVDLDGFKEVNDTHGHAVGDQVLQVIAKRLTDAVRGDDVVGRLGGDEFVILCPTLTGELAHTTAARIEAAVASPIAVGGLTLVSGASTGVVTSTSGGSADQVLEEADVAMYAVKRQRKADELARSAPADGGAPIHPDEARRMDALRRLGLLDTPGDPFIDEIVRMAADVCGTPMAAVSLIDTDRQWFKSSIGLPSTETSRSSAFCAHTILDDRDVFVVDDASSDARFDRNELVTGDPNIRFYAGAPIAVGGEPAVGSLCVIDDTPRQLRADQIRSLERLRDSLVTYLELGGDHAGGRLAR